MSAFTDGDDHVHDRIEGERPKRDRDVADRDGAVLLCYPDLSKALRNRLKVLRAERDWSQAELGGRLGVSRQAVNAIETGKYDPSLPLAFRIARLFDLKIEEVFHDGGNDGSA